MDVAWDDAEVVVDASVEEEMVELDVAVEMAVEDVVEEVEVVLDEALADEVVASEVTVELALDDFDVEVEVDEVLSQVAVADTDASLADSLAHRTDWAEEADAAQLAETTLADELLATAASADCSRSNDRMPLAMPQQITAIMPKYNGPWA